MENKQSGLVTPPIVSPRPIQSQKTDEAWKVVGSPPRRPLLSPPEERERTKAEDASSSDLTTKTSLVTTSAPSESLSLHQSPRQQGPLSSSLSTGEDGQSNARASFGPTINTSQLGHSSSTSTRPSSAVLGSPLNASAPTFHLRTSTSASFENRQRQDAPSYGPLDSNTNTGIHDFAGVNLHSPNGRHPPGLTKPANDFNLDFNGNRRQSNSGLESPLSLSSTIWNGNTGNSNNGTPNHPLTSTPTTRMNPSSSSNLSGMTLSLLEEEESNARYSKRSSSPPGMPQNYRTMRSLSYSEPGTFSNGLGLDYSTSGSLASFAQENDDLMGPFKAPLPTMDEEAEDSFEPRMSRTRSYSTSAAFGSGAFYGGSLSGSSFDSSFTQDTFGNRIPSQSSLHSQDPHPFLNQKLAGGLTWSPASSHGLGFGQEHSSMSNRRRSITSSSFIAPPIWESSENAFQPGPSLVEQERAERQRLARRFSLAPASGFQTYDRFLEHDGPGSPSMTGYNRQPMIDNDFAHQAQRRHSVAGPSSSYHRSNPTPFGLATSFESLQLDGGEVGNSWNGGEYYESEAIQDRNSGMNDLGKGLSLGQLPHHGSLYVVEFKAGRSDLFYVTDNSGLTLKRGDLVMVEADRGKDLGKITNDSITPQQIQELQAQQAEAAAIAAQQDGHRAPKEIHPKRIFRLAHTEEVSLLVNKNQDELKAMMVCQTKVRQKKLPMEVVDAEYQWDRRKLTFYFIAERRIDFRELVRDLFKIYKTRIWMYAVNPSMAAGHITPPLSMHSPTSPQPRQLNVFQQQHSHQQAQQQQRHQQQPHPLDLGSSSQHHHQQPQHHQQHQHPLQPEGRRLSLQYSGSHQPLFGPLLESQDPHQQQRSRQQLQQDHPHHSLHQHPLLHSLS